ncbi:mitochondrial proton/calcium exchanger protein-like isoform X2 [Lycorma delicatula]|uniref:mitochondrial proton/calcium exchanger protein-like isoform X2 n=1 Tax=Lycorma delicatula TaxID=130591 RepID=UPI003F50E21A
MYAKHFLSVNKTAFMRTNHLIKGGCRCCHVHTLKSSYDFHPSCTYYYRMQWNRKKSSQSKNEVHCSIIKSSKLFYSENKINFLYGRSLQLFNVPLISSFNSSRNFHLTAVYFGDGPNKPSSKIEETVQALKEKAKEKEFPQVSSAPIVEKKPDVVKTSTFQMIRKKVVDELVHYYHGFRLLFIDINVSRKLVWRVLNGHTLRRREKKLLIRTVGDIFRLIPFSVFIIVPFMEILLPVFIKLFPGMLPSTFQTATEKEDKMKQSLKLKLEMAKFLQQTLDEMAVAGKGHKSESAKEFGEFFEKVRSGSGMTTAEEIIKFSKLFDDEITLDTLPRPQLMALCRVLEIQPFGTTNFLRFQLRMKLRNLVADDLAIQKEGVDSLNLWELQQACKARGMRALGMSEEQLKSQLKQWLDLSLNEKVPPSLLLLSRAFILREAVPRSTTEKLAAAISNLPDSVAAKAKEALGELEGKMDNKTKIEIIKEEVKRIREERKEEHEELEREAKKELEEIIDKAPVVEDKAPIMQDPILSATSTPVKEKTAAKEKEDVVTSVDLGVIENALDTISKEKKKLIVEKEEIHELKEELAEYKEDVQDLKELHIVEVKESKGAKRLFKVVNNLIGKLDDHVAKLEQKEEAIKKDLETLQQKKESEDQKVDGKDSQVVKDELLKIDDLIGVIRKIQKVPDDSRLDRISEVLDKMDADQDGAIRVDTVLKVVELIGNENLKLNKKQITEIIDLIKKEEQITLQEQLEKTLKEKDPVDVMPQNSSSVLKNVFEKELPDVTEEKRSSPIEEISRETMKQSRAAAIAKPTSESKPNIMDPKSNNVTPKNL